MLESTKLTNTFRTIIMQFLVLFIIFFFIIGRRKLIYIDNIKKYKYLDDKVQNDCLFIKKYQNAIFIIYFNPLSLNEKKNSFKVKKHKNIGF